MNILVVGSSGFIGSNLVEKLMKQGHYVVGTDIEMPKYVNPNEFYKLDFRKELQSRIPFSQGLEFSEAYCLGCCMGGMGYIGDEVTHGYDIAIGSMQIVLNFIQHCKDYNVGKVFYSSSACIYNQDLQREGDVSLKETDAIPANCDLLYGWQKLYSEFCFMASGLDCRIARFHNIFGRYGSYDNGKEKAPAALVRKAILSNDFVEVWGDGTARRSFLWIDECLDGVERLMASDYNKPLNIGSDESISINDLAEMIIKISGKKLTIKNVEGNVGVQSRNSNNEHCGEVLGWKPSQNLETGICLLYNWINLQVNGSK